MTALQLADEIQNHAAGKLGNEVAEMLRSQAARIARLVAALTRISNIDDNNTGLIAAEALQEIGL